ncbi:MAG: hypothetical protein K0S78_5261, partial [Thermomicrobiales bacterium]|nr:hypothetical protein [Thermomicrobiales bacterium]
ETFMIYPNVFQNPPASLELAMAFMSERGPSDFFPPLGFLSWVGGLGALVLGWRIASARWWIALSVLMIVAEGIVSMLFMWPRNEILFVEGLAVHSAETLRQTAAEFQMLHWSRLAFNAVSAASIFVGFVAVYPIFVGFVAVYRQRVLAEAAEAATRETSADRQQRTPDQTRALAGPVAAR